jgi:hypothetical protein
MPLNGGETVERVWEQEEPEQPDAERKIKGALEEIANREKAALTNEDGNGDAGDPMDWDP